MYSNECFQFIVRSRFIWHPLAAFYASMKDYPAAFAVLIEMQRLHCPSTSGGPVSGPLIIDVFAPQAQRTMISIGAIFKRLYVRFAVFARKRFLTGDECH